MYAFVTLVSSNNVLFINLFYFQGICQLEIKKQHVCGICVWKKFMYDDVRFIHYIFSEVTNDGIVKLRLNCSGEWDREKSIV